MADDRKLRAEYLKAQKGMNIGLSYQTWLENKVNELQQQYNLPTKFQLEKVIEDDYKKQYGTNYDKMSLQNAKQGGLIITNWILNNL